MLHKLKLKKKYYKISEQGLKNFEVRKNDRNYKIDDLLLLCEINDELKFTGNSHLKQICYILDDSDFVKEGYVILGVEIIHTDILNMDYLTFYPEKELNKIFKDCMI